MENELLIEETTPIEEAPTEPAAEVEGEQAAEAVSTEAEGEENPEAAPITPEEDLFTLRFNHEDVSVPKTEAVRLAQLGKHYEEKTKPLLDDLDYYATIHGKTVTEVVKELVDGIESAYRDELSYQLGSDSEMIEELMEVRRAKNRKNYEESKAAREKSEREAEEAAEKDTATRLAEQFDGLRDIFPEFDTIEKVPDSVIKRAVKSGDLEKELLRYEKSERVKIEAAKASEELNKKSNVGSVHSAEAENGIETAFMRGLWG